MEPSKKGMTKNEQNMVVLTMRLIEETNSRVEIK
jgi:hypothetical protein